MLENLVFFNPSKDFIKKFSDDPWMRYRRIIEVGAGTGRLSKLLDLKGLDVTAIDLVPRRKPEFKVEMADGMDFEFNLNDVVLMARPCHGGFAQNATSRAVDAGALAFYIGLERNLERDFDPDMEVKRIDHWGHTVGDSDEGVWQVLGRRTQMRTFHLVRLKDWGEDSWEWRKLIGTRYVAANNSYFSSNDPDMLIKDRATALEHQQLRPYMSLLPRSKVGWCAPDGLWFGCESYGHEYVVYDILGIAAARAEKLGFVRCHGFADSLEGTYTVPFEHRLTPKQKRTLQSKDYMVRE